MRQKKEMGTQYFQAIEFGIDKLEEGVLFSDFNAHLEQLGIELSEYRTRIVFGEFYEVKEYENRAQPFDAMDQDSIFVLRPEAVFRHLEHIELTEARQSSRRAMYIAIGSLTLAAIVGFVQISLSIECRGENQNWLSRWICCE